MRPSGSRRNRLASAPSKPPNNLNEAERDNENAHEHERPEDCLVRLVQTSARLSSNQKGAQEKNVEPVPPAKLIREVDRDGQERRDPRRQQEHSRAPLSPADPAPPTLRPSGQRTGAVCLRQKEGAFLPAMSWSRNTHEGRKSQIQLGVLVRTRPIGMQLEDEDTGKRSVVGW